MQNESQCKRKSRRVLRREREVKELKTTETKNNRVSCLQNKNKNATFGFHRTMKDCVDFDDD